MTTTRRTFLENPADMSGMFFCSFFDPQANEFVTATNGAGELQLDYHTITTDPGELASTVASILHGYYQNLPILITNFNIVIADPTSQLKPYGAPIHIIVAALEFPMYEGKTAAVPVFVTPTPPTTAQVGAFIPLIEGICGFALHWTMNTEHTCVNPPLFAGTELESRVTN